ncbi:MAG: amidohydrolase [Candidatus Fermentibacteraceae bacterium]
MDHLTTLRHRLHSRPELSHHEELTAAELAGFLKSLNAGELATGLGGNGLALVFAGVEAGPRVLLRADMDALPIPDSIGADYACEEHGIGHKCGHDGHMAILCGVAERLAASPPAGGEAVLLFQPAEETGEGAALVLADGAFRRFLPDRAYALHNLPGFPQGSVVIREGCFASASRGMVVELHGESAHAAQPHLARGPALAVARLITGISSLPQTATALHQPAKATVIHARLGSEAFGTTPGEAVVMATLRTHSEEAMDDLACAAERLAKSATEPAGLDVRISWKQEFPATINDPDAAEYVAAAAAGLGLDVIRPSRPFPWSEDFGHFTGRFGGALFGLGAGEDHAPLHSSTYDFPDGLIPVGVDLLEALLRRSLAGG